MAQLGMNFDANQVEPNDFSPVPAGEYKVMIADSSMELTKDQSGQFLKIQMQVLEGPSQGKTIFDRLNLVNRSQKAMEIAQRTLSAICHATGQMQVSDSAQLHNIPIAITVAVSADGNYNEVKKYVSIVKQQQAPVQQPAQQPVMNQQPAAQMQQPVQQQQPVMNQQPVVNHPQDPVPPWATQKAS